jgi:hypothetical protein
MWSLSFQLGVRWESDVWIRRAAVHRHIRLNPVILAILLESKKLIESMGIWCVAEVVSGCHGRLEK